MKKRSLLSTLAVLALFGTATSRAATVSISVTSLGGSPSFVDSLGTFLAAGDVVRVGFFNTSTQANLTTLETSNSYAAVNALFTALAEGNSGGGTVSETGAPGNQMVINDLVGTSGSVFGSIGSVDAAFCTPGTEMAIWVFNSSDPQNASEWGIFTTSSGWEFPSSPGSQTMSTSEINDVIRGSQNGSNYALSVVPEPGSWVLLMVGAVVLNYRRHRRQGKSAWRVE